MGIPVRVLARPQSDRTLLERLDVEVVEGDVRSREALDRACQGVDVVFHAAARLGEWGPRAEFVDINVTAVGALMEAAARAHVRRVVHISSVAVYGRARGPIVESAPWRHTGHPYMDTKAVGEATALTLGRRHGVEVAVARPCLVYGPRDRGFLPYLRRNLERGRMLIIGRGDHLANTVYVGTVADLCVRLAHHPRAAFEAFNVTDPDPLSWRELLTAIALRAGVGPPHVAVPAGIAYAMGGAMELGARLLGSTKPPPLTRFIAGVLGTDLSYSTTKARNVLDFEPRVGVREGLDLAFGSRPMGG